MRSSFQRLFATTLLSCALVAPPLAAFAQDAPRQPATRPRRATAPEWPTRSNPDEPAPLPEVEPEPVHLAGEPVIRIGLATGARSVTVSTTAPALGVTDPAEQPLPLEVARVRVEPRSYPPLPTPAPDGGDAFETASAKSSAAPDTKPVAHAADAGAKSDVTAAAALDARRSDSTPGVAAAGVRLTSRAAAPLRGEALYAPGSSKPLLDLRAPVVFSSADPEQHPVRYNEKPYRGRLEVFANTKGALTVVNVLTLEDYVRGVVPNELSPGGWPELEALKAQAVAARTYAVSNLGRFAAEGFDLTPDTRSQVYGGRSTEHPLSDRAVLETRGRIATYKGAPINALYTSTCGGRTEDGENIFGGASVAYLRGRECALDAAGHFFAPVSVRTSREPANIKSAEHATSARDAALLAVHGFDTPARLSDE
jgi:stage II sporulation protein D